MARRKCGRPLLTALRVRATMPFCRQQIQHQAMTPAKSGDAAGKPAKGHTTPKRTMMPFVRELVRPYRHWLAIVLAAMLVETLMSLAAPWPLKLVLDDALGAHKLPAVL